MSLANAHRDNGDIPLREKQICRVTKQLVADSTAGICLLKELPALLTAFKYQVWIIIFESFVASIRLFSKKK